MKCKWRVYDTPKSTLNVDKGSEPLPLLDLPPQFAAPAFEARSGVETTNLDSRLSEKNAYSPPQESVMWISRGYQASLHATRENVSAPVTAWIFFVLSLLFPLPRQACAEMN